MRALSWPACIALIALAAATAQPVAKKPPEQKPDPNEYPQALTARPSSLQATPVSSWALPVSPASVNMNARPAEGTLSVGATAGNTQIDSRLNIDPARGQMTGIAVSVRVGPTN